MDVYNFCKLECEIQQDLQNLNGMLVAFSTAKMMSHRGMRIDKRLILQLFSEAKPGVRSYRTTPVTFKDGSLGLAPDLIERAMDNLINAFNTRSVTPEEFYQEFERIHPCVDGNGRVGALLFNMLNGSMNDPVLPPKFKKV